MHNNMDQSTLRFREDLQPTDREAVRRLVDATDFFSPEEGAIALELVDERLTRGDASGYQFLFAEKDGQVAAYTCYGPIPGTRCSYDLYWTVVDPLAHRLGIGRQVLSLSEILMAARGAGRIYADTSSRSQYAPTRAFYEACGYKPAAFLNDFYAPGDGKVIYVKEIAAETG